MNTENTVISANDSNERKKFLFLKQVETLNSFLQRGAISKAQYDVSFNGLITKMEISQEQLREWGTDIKTTT
ncbi:MAG: hypothetical protein E7649_04510 [Ruminococcaceae bacterium]|nr:hypothetical protein [Oscillospiraceae bacterium]